MKFFDRPLKKKEIFKLQSVYGKYLKLTIDIENQWLVAGGELHADGEKILLEKGSNQDNIWGGGLSLEDKEIDTTAVLNLRPKMNNDAMEILNPKLREKFISVVKDFFRKLWL